MKFEVRCCCVPMKLMGWLEVPVIKPEHNLDLFYEVLIKGPNSLPSTTTVKRIKLTFAEFWTMRDPDWPRKFLCNEKFQDEYLALKSNDHSIEDLKLIPKFEAHPFYKEHLP